MRFSAPRRLAVLAFAGALLVRAPSGGAQQVARPFAVFLDCTAEVCDDDFIHSEISSVDWVRDRTASQVHILVTSEPTGGGGSKVTLAFLGGGMFAGVSDTLTFFNAQGATDDELRHDVVRLLSAGLVRYFARTDAARGLTIAFAPAPALPGKPVTDPWNSWVMSVNALGSASRDEVSASLAATATLSADRVTEASKTSIAVNEQYGDNSFTIDGGRIVFVQRNYSATLLHVKSLTNRLSAGLKGTVTSSTFLNERVAARLTPAIEFDLFPYSEATRRQLRLQYGIGVSAYNYYDTTLAGKTREVLRVQTASIAMSRRETWGSASAGVDATSYLSDLARRRIAYTLGATVRVAQGLSLSVSANYESVHDQFYVPKNPISRDATLLRQTEQSTRFSQSLLIGFLYSFGSVRNNVVNPRFSIGGGAP